MSVSRDMGSCETMPRHHWLHNVTLAAIRAGATAEAVDAQRERLVSWFIAGEPIWMAVEGLVFACKRAAIEERADRLPKMNWDWTLPPPKPTATVHPIATARARRTEKSR